MATIQEKTADVATLIDDWAGMLLGLSSTVWTDADTSVVNDGSGEEPHKNGRVLANSNTGTFVFLFVDHQSVENADYNSSTRMRGVRVIHSSDWDTSAHRPAGLTNVVGERDPWDQNEITNRTHSFAQTYTGTNPREGNSYDDMDSERQGNYRAGIGLFTSAATGSTRTGTRTDTATYYLSGRDNGFQAAVWSTSDGTDGIASYLSFEYLDSKFISDGEVPVAISYADSERNNGTEMNAISSYGFRSWGVSPATPVGTAGCTRGAVSAGEWGMLNPDADDDTFFYRSPVVYSNVDVQRSREGRRYDSYPEHYGPVAFIEDSLPNQPGQGTAHGDLVTVDGTTYRMMVQSGAGRDNAIGVGLRYE